MKKNKQYFSLNLLSLSGYILAICFLLIIFYFYPQALKESLKNGPTDNFEITVGLFLWLINIIKYFLAIEATLLVLTFVESKIYKCNQVLYDKFFNNIPDKIKEIHTILFYTGIVFALIPVILLILFILNIIVEFIFLY